MLVRLTLACVATLALTSPVLAENPAPAPVPATNAPKAEKMICEDIQELGSRLNSHRVCMTKSQWQQQRYADRDLIDKSQKELPTQPAG